VTQLNYRDFVRSLGQPEFRHHGLPAEKISHLIRPSKTGVDSHGLRTLCGLGQKHNVWRITIQGAAVNVNGDGWSICAACCQRAKPFLEQCLPKPPPSRPETQPATFVFADGRTEAHPAEMFLDRNGWLPAHLVGNGWPLPKLEFRRVADDDGRAVYVEAPPDGQTCGRSLDCGSSCWQPPGHSGPCLCVSDEDGVPGTCPA
jgi:hypothetical protein